MHCNLNPRIGNGEGALFSLPPWVVFAKSHRVYQQNDGCFGCTVTE